MKKPWVGVEKIAASDAAALDNLNITHSSEIKTCTISFYNKTFTFLPIKAGNRNFSRDVEAAIFFFARREGRENIFCKSCVTRPPAINNDRSLM